MEESPHNLAQHSARGFIGRHRVRARWSVALAILLVLPIWGAVSIGTTATRSHIAGGLMDTVSHQRMLGQDVAWHARLLAERPDDAARRARLARAIADLQESSADLGQRLSEAPASTRFMIRPTQHAEIDDACRQLLEAADAIAMLSTGQHAENLFASRDASSGALEEAGRMHFEATAGFIAEMRAAQRVRSTAAVDRLRLLLMLELVLAGIAILLVIEPTVRWMRRREAAWEDQQAQLEYFFANSLDVLCICDQKGRLMKVNQAWTDLVGIDPEKLKGRNFVEFVHPEDTDRTLRELEKLIEVGECDDFRNRYRTQAGSWRTIEWRGTARGGLIFAAARDISDRLEMEHALALQAERMELALAAGDVGTWDWKVATDMLSVDERWAAMIGESPAEVGNTVDAWASRVHPTDLPMCLDRLDKCFKDNVPYKDVLFRMRHRDGSWRWIQASGSVVQWEGDQPIRMVGTQLDVTDRIRIENQRRESNQRMNLALQAGQMGLWEWDLDTGEFHFDERWADMLGERAGDLLSDASIVLSRIHRDDQEVFEQAVQAHIDGRTPEVSLQIRLRHAEGVWRWFRVYGKSNSTMNDRGGKRLVGIQMDVHEQVSAQRELARREEMLANTARMTGIGAWEVDLTTMELFWSDAVRDIHEVDRSYVPNVEEGINFYDPQDRARVSEAVRRGVEFGEPFDIECRLITAKGNKRWVRSVGEPVYQDGRIIALTGAFQDITEDRAQRLAIEESNRALEAAQAISRMGSWSFDIRSGTTRWSKHLFEIFERDAAEGAPDLQAVLAGYTPESSKRLEEAVQRAIDDAESYALTLERTNATNGVRYVAVDGRVGTDKAGRVTGIYGTARDVTAEVENETALREARLQAEDANRSKTEFLANMSHEIRTPMTAILGFADLLEDPDLDEAQRADHVTTIKRNGEHLLTIINDILDISKIEAGRMVIETIETLPDGVVRGVAGSLRVATEARGLRMSLSCKTRIPRTVRTDPTRLRQILLNLLGNAVKFTETGGVKVELSYDPCETGGVLRYEVTDTGIGMTPQQVEKCFEAFNQADASVTRRFGGTGLGLRISQRLAEALGGDLTVSSEEGRGSTFTLTVRAEAAGEQWIGPGPIALTVPEPRQTPRQSEGGDLANLHVLLLEDGQDNLRLISTHLRASGAKVTTARTGLQGLERLALDAEGRSSRAAPFDVILTDMQMPEMDGYEFVRNVRGNGCTLPIIALTAHAMADDEQRCLDVGCDAYAAKPITRRQLIDVIRESIKLRPAA